MAQQKPQQKPLYRVLILPDIHIPYQDRRSLTAVEQLMADYEWDELVQVGDFIDLDCISSHNDGKPGNIEGKTLASDFAEANRVLDRWQRLAKSAKITFLEGNHEERVLRFIEKVPQLRGTIEVPKLLRFAERGIRWVPYWSEDRLYRIGNLFFAHGRYTNDAHAKKMVSSYGVSIVYGHVHDVQSYSYVQKGLDKTLMGQSIGCLCEEQKYMQGAPNKWQQAFAVANFFGDGYFTLHVIRIFKHRFEYGGKVYQG